MKFSHGQATIAHNLVVQNLAIELDQVQEFRDASCAVLTQGIPLLMGENRFYPDVMVCCNVTQRDTSVREPLLLVEVLSPESAFTDLVEKVQAYQTIPSLRAYLIVHPDQVWVRAYQREKGKWNAPIDYQFLSDVAYVPLELIYHQIGV